MYRQEFSKVYTCITFQKKHHIIMETFPNSYFQNAVSVSRVSNEKHTFSLPVKTPPLPLWDTLLFSISFRKYLLGSTMLILSLQKRLDNLEKFSLHSRKTCNSSLISITLSTLPQNNQQTPLSCKKCHWSTLISLQIIVNILLFKGCFYKTNHINNTL